MSVLCAACTAAMLAALIESHKRSRQLVLSSNGVEIIVQTLVAHPTSHKLMQHASQVLERLLAGMPQHPEDEAATRRATKALEEARARWPK